MILAFLFALLTTLMSPVGIAAFLFGLVAFFLLPFIPRVTNQFHSFARFHQRLAGMMLKRAAIVVSEQGDLLLKRMKPDDTGVELISFKDNTKEFEDTHEAASSWLGMRFALADEVHGFLFDTTDPAIGRRKRIFEQADEMVAKATARERESYDVKGWVRGVLSFPDGTPELVNLNDVRYLVSGSERAEHPQKVESFYEISESFYDDGPSASRLILLVIALIGPFALIWILATQLGGPSSTVSFGTLALLALPGDIEVSDLKRWVTAALVILPLPAIIILIAVFISPIYAAVLLTIGLLGFVLVPLLTQLLKISDKAAVGLSKPLLKLGLMGYDTPVLNLTPTGYETVEYRNMDDTEHVVFHRFLGRKFGFSFAPSPDVWDNEVIQQDELANRTESQSAHKTSTPTNIPVGFKRIPERTRAVYGDFVPKRVKSSKYYIKTGIALERFKNVAVGQKSNIRLTEAKEEHGGNSSMDDRTIAFLMTGLGLVSFLAGLAVFMLPAFL